MNAMSSVKVTPLICAEMHKFHVFLTYKIYIAISLIQSRFVRCHSVVVHCYIYTSDVRCRALACIPPRCLALLLVFRATVAVC